MNFTKLNLIIAMIFSMTLQFQSDIATANQAIKSDCQWAGGGTHHVMFDKLDQRVTYRLSSKNETWLNSSFGWHSTGVLKCEDCVDGSPASGMYHFTDDDASYFSRNSPLGIPRTAKQRIERAYETFGYPNIQVSGQSLLPLTFQDNIQLDRYTGYAVIFKVDLNDHFLFHSQHLASREIFLLILSLTDGCLKFETTIAMEKSPRQGIALADSILSDISISYQTKRLEDALKDEGLDLSVDWDRLNKPLIGLMPNGN